MINIKKVNADADMYIKEFAQGYHDHAVKTVGKFEADRRKKFYTKMIGIAKVEYIEYLQDTKRNHDLDYMHLFFSGFVTGLDVIQRDIVEKLRPDEVDQVYGGR